MPIGLWTGADQGNTMVEDVKDLITNIDYESTPFYSSIGESAATNTLHQWLLDTYAASADNAFPEGGDVTHTDITPPSRSTNIVQLFNKEVKVTNTEQRVAHYGMGDPYTYQLQKKLKEMARDIEKALVAGTRASGDSGVARRLNGAIAMITTNKTARASGTSLTENEFNDIMAGIWTNGTDISVDKVFTGATLKRAISGYTAGSTKFTQADGKQLYNTVSVYESDFGVHTVHLEREVPSGANAKGILCVDSSKWKTAYLTDGQPQHMPLATTGSAKKGMIEAELTLESLNEKSSAYRSGYV
jgi:hypothetical protein